MGQVERHLKMLQKPGKHSFSNLLKTTGMKTWLSSVKEVVGRVKLNHAATAHLTDIIAEMDKLADAGEFMALRAKLAAFELDATIDQSVKNDKVNHYRGKLRQGQISFIKNMADRIKPLCPISPGTLVKSFLDSIRESLEVSHKVCLHPASKTLRAAVTFLHASLVLHQHSNGTDTPEEDKLVELTALTKFVELVAIMKDPAYMAEDATAPAEAADVYHLTSANWHGLYDDKKLVDVLAELIAARLALAAAPGSPSRLSWEQVWAALNTLPDWVRELPQVSKVWETTASTESFINAVAKVAPPQHAGGVPVLPESLSPRQQEELLNQVIATSAESILPDTKKILDFVTSAVLTLCSSFIAPPPSSGGLMDKCRSSSARPRP
mmetsp:Transcript_88090/g.184098  ORF Transcript_88090/g.184098 Transcript_88090/m.184098 type:complete len:381 (-) Transcript_88090:695-1837(-)